MFQEMKPLRSNLESQGWIYLITTPDYTPQTDSSITGAQNTVGGEVTTNATALPSGTSIKWSSYKYLLFIAYWVDSGGTKRMSYLLQDRSVLNIIIDDGASPYDTLDRGITVAHGSFIGVIVDNTSEHETKYPYIYASFHKSSFVPTKVYVKIYGKK